MLTTTRKTSKTSTPVSSTFSDSLKGRSRPSRGGADALTMKRSHKKGAGGSGAHATGINGPNTTGAGAGAREEEGSSMQDGEMEHDVDDEDDDADDDSEPRYCYCNQVSYGEMVACDADSCPREWFHLDCVGLSKAPTKNGISPDPLFLFRFTAMID